MWSSGRSRPTRTSCSETRPRNEAFVLIKDKEWSGRLARYAAMLPSLQSELPVPAAYKREKPGSDSDLNAYDAVYYAGDANAGSKTIAINLPNDEEVQLRKGTRRLQLKNAMQAKFDKILVPIAGELIAEDQQQHINFDAFFANIMFHEVAHGLGIKNTVRGKGTVREALKEQAGALEEGKADILGLYMITKLHQRGELKDQEPRRQLRDLPGRHLPVDPVRRLQRARPGQCRAVLLLPGPGCVRPRLGDRPLPGRLSEDAHGRRCPRGADPPLPGRWRLRRSHPVHGRARQASRHAAAGSGAPRFEGHSGGHRLRAGR